MNNNTSCSTFEIVHAHVSDMGMRRMNNQDAIAVMVTSDAATWASRGHLLMVADGMGAHAAGELASKLAVDNIPHNYFKLRDQIPPAALRQAIRDANRVIHSKGQSSIGFQGMGTTCSCLVLLPQGALVAHIGDSRVYRLRAGVLEQLTFDHSLVWEMAQAGQIPEAEVPAYIPKNVITRSLGPHPSVNIDVEGPYDVAPGDVFLICSDGLSGQVTDEELGAVLECLPPDEAVQSLVDLANLRGGPDNISVIAARVPGDASSQPGGGHLSPAAEAPKDNAANIWLLMSSAACLVFFVYCLTQHWWIGAILSGGLAAAFVGRWLTNAGATSFVPAGSLGGPYGDGPYRKVECGPSRSVARALADIAGKIRALPEKQSENWKVDWQSFDALREKAAAAVDAGQLADAVRHYCRAIHGIMQQLRDHRPTISDDDSGIYPVQ
jgi:protein phosphatase